MPLFRQRPHGDRRHDHDEENRHDAEETAERGLAREEEGAEVEPASDEQEAAENDVGDGRAEERSELALRDGEGAFHLRPPFAVRRFDP